MFLGNNGTFRLVYYDSQINVARELINCHFLPNFYRSSLLSLAIMAAVSFDSRSIKSTFLSDSTYYGDGLMRTCNI